MSTSNDKSNVEYSEEEKVRFKHYNGEDKVGVIGSKYTENDREYFIIQSKGEIYEKSKSDIEEKI